MTGHGLQIETRNAQSLIQILIETLIESLIGSLLFIRDWLFNEYYSHQYKSLIWNRWLLIRLISWPEPDQLRDPLHSTNSLSYLNCEFKFVIQMSRSGMFNETKTFSQNLRHQSQLRLWSCQTMRGFVYEEFDLFRIKFGGEKEKNSMNNFNYRRQTMQYQKGFN